MKGSKEARLFYQRLKHMVDRDPIQILTQQPAKGQSRDRDLCFLEIECIG